MFDPISSLAAPVTGAVTNLAATAVDSANSFASVLKSAVEAVQGESPDQQSSGVSPDWLGELIPIQDLLASVDQLLHEFHQGVRDVLDREGIDTWDGIQFTQDSMGALRVVGDHPEKDRIEAALAGEFDLSQTFAKISAATTIQRAIDQHLEFAAAYEKDPKSAVQRFASLFTEKREQGIDISVSPFEATIGEF